MGNYRYQVCFFRVQIFHNVWWGIEEVHQKVGYSTNQKLNAPEEVSSNSKVWNIVCKDYITYQTQTSIFWSGTSLRYAGKYIMTNLSAPQMVKWIITPRYSIHILPALLISWIDALPLAKWNWCWRSIQWQCKESTSVSTRHPGVFAGQEVFYSCNRIGDTECRSLV